MKITYIICKEYFFLNSSATIKYLATPLLGYPKILILEICEENYLRHRTQYCIVFLAFMHCSTVDPNNQEITALT
jgi:hypothetical protein